MMRPLIGQPSLFNHRHCNYRTIAHSRTHAEKMAPHRKNILQRAHTHTCTDPSLKHASLWKESKDFKKTHVQFTPFLHYLLLSVIHTCAGTLVRCKISSISCLLSFSLRVLYLTITCNDRDITIMITPFANAALSTHARTHADRYTHAVHRLVLFSVCEAGKYSSPLASTNDMSIFSKHVCLCVSVQVRW